MAEALEQIRILGPVREADLPPLVSDEAAERRARADLRAQIARLERELAELFASAYPRRGIEWRVGALGGPRVLGTGELERVRDALAARLRDVRTELARRADAEEANRGLLESMIAAPEEHRWVIVSNEDIGEQGCRHWHSRPRWGLLGMLLGWWRVRVSSGCPLAAGLAAPSTCPHELRIEEEAASPPPTQSAAAATAGCGRPGEARAEAAA